MSSKKVRLVLLALAWGSLAQTYARGQGVQNDAATAFQREQEACNSGSAKSCDTLAQMYDQGGPVQKDPAEAAQLYQKACDGGNLEGCLHLGAKYLTGQGVQQDTDKAVHLFRRACDGSVAVSCLILGALYEYGKGVPRDAVQALQLFQKACDGGDSGGCSILAETYARGEGGQQDDAKAAQFYQKACDTGDMGSCVAVGEMYAKGEGVQKDDAQALQLFRKACDAGEKKGCADLKPATIPHPQEIATPGPAEVAGSKSPKQSTTSRSRTTDNTPPVIALPLEVESSTAWTRVRINFSKSLPGLVLIELRAPIYQAETSGFGAGSQGQEPLLWADGAELVMGGYIATPQGQLTASGDEVVVGPQREIRSVLTGGWLVATNKLSAYAFESDPQFPLTFRVVRDQGLVYLCGRGQIRGLGVDLRLGQQSAMTDWSAILLKGQSVLSREGAAQAMGWLKDPKWVPPLIAAMTNSTEDVAVRRSAIEAAGRICDARALPILEKLASDGNSHLSKVAQWARQEIKNCGN
jgi:TPR repeat protein